MEVDEKSRLQEFQWVACMGDFDLLKNFLDEKRHSLGWKVLGFFDAFFRGCGQVVFANNPISGIIIMIAFALTVPGTLVASAGTGLLGLLLSLLLRDSRDNIGNGLTVYNPLLIGSVTYALAQNSYGPIDAPAISMIIIGTIFSVYLTRSLGTGRFPCITVPFNVAEIILLLVLSMQRDFSEITAESEVVTMMSDELKENSTENSYFDAFDNQTFTAEQLNWGLVFRGVIASASQVYAVDDVAAGSAIYLGIVVYSPLTALFALLGALAGSLAALGLGVPAISVYSGLWGYNGLLTGAALGGLFIVMSGQTGAAALVAILFTTVLQYVLEPIIAKVGLPVLTVPFVVTAWLFFGLRDSDGGSFPRPTSISFPEHELYVFRLKRQELDLLRIDDNSDPEMASPDENKSSND